MTSAPTRRTGRGIALLLGVALLLLAPGFASFAQASPAPDRLAGADRYATAAAISAANFAPGVPVVYIAYGGNFPDALSGAAAAATNHGPVLLVPTTGIPGPVAAELTRLAPAKIVILGGTSVVSSAVESALHAYTSGEVIRLAGADRYATSAAISAATFAPGVGAAYIAVGTSFPDALAGAAAAGHQGDPVLLVNTTSIPGPIAAELTRLAPQQIFVLGGTSVVSSAVESALHAYTAGTVTRLAGPDRYATAAAISAATYESADTVYLANGLNFPDALAAAALGNPLLMAPPTSLPAVDTAEIARLGSPHVVIVGGVSAISETVAYAVSGIDYPSHWVSDIYDAQGVRWEQPNNSACTAASAMMMLNMIAYQSPTKGDGFAWTPSISYDLQNSMLAWERTNDTMVGGTGSDPHGWRNALNYYGWGSLAAGVYADKSYASFDDAVKAAVSGLARYGKPTGLLMLNGGHADLITGYDVTGDDPASGSPYFTVNSVKLTDPWQPNGHRDYTVSLSSLRSGSTWLKFGPYYQTDSPYRDPIDGQVGKTEWYGRYVIIVATK